MFEVPSTPLPSYPTQHTMTHNTHQIHSLAELRRCLAAATGPPGGSQTSGFNPDSSCNDVRPNFPNYHSSTRFDTFPLTNKLFNSILTPISFLIFHIVPINIYNTYYLISHSCVASHIQSNKDSCNFRNYTIINNNSSS